MSPETREWPPTLRRLAKLSLGIVYAGSAVAGWHVVVSADGADTSWWSVALGALAGTGGVLALGTMLREWWMFERPAAWLVAFALSVYALIDAARLGAAVWTAWQAIMAGVPAELWASLASWDLPAAGRVADDAALGLLYVAIAPTTGPDVGATALLWVSAAAVGLRIVHLWAFDLNLNLAASRAEAARRARQVARDTEERR